MESRWLLHSSLGFCVPAHKVFSIPGSYLEAVLSVNMVEPTLVGTKWGKGKNS